MSSHQGRLYLNKTNKKCPCIHISCIPTPTFSRDCLKFVCHQLQFTEQKCKSNAVQSKIFEIIHNTNTQKRNLIVCKNKLTNTSKAWVTFTRPLIINLGAVKSGEGKDVSCEFYVVMRYAPRLPRPPSHSSLVWTPLRNFVWPHALRRAEHHYQADPS